MKIVLFETINFLKVNIIEITWLTIIIQFPFILFLNIDMLCEPPDIIGVWVSFVGIAYVFVVQPFSTGAQVSLYSQIINTETFDSKKCISESRKNLSHLVIATFCYTVLLFGGLLLFIVPGIIIGSRLSFYPFYIIYEGYKPLAALKESFYATQRYVWDIAGPVIIINLTAAIPIIFFAFFFQGMGFFHYLTWIFLDLVLSMVGWLNIIVAFRFYCIKKNETI